MTPPQLTRDTPILNVLQPVLVGVHVFLRIELQFAVQYGWEGDVGKVLHLEEPLQRETGLDSCIRVALRIAHLIDIVLDLLHQSGFLQVLGNLLAADHTVHTDVDGTLLGDGAIGVEDVDGLQVMRLAQHIVVGVVGWRHLQTAGTELDIHVTVFNNGNDAVHQRHNHLATLEPLVLGVLGVDAHGCIAHDGLWTCGGDNGIVALCILMDDIALCLQSLFVIQGGETVHIILQVEQMALLFFVDHLLGRKSGECLWIPVHHAETAIDEALVIEVDEYLDDTLAAFLVHGKGGAVPIAAGAEAAKLFEDDTTMLMSPFPGMLQELLSCEVSFLDAFASEFLYHFGLSGDRGVVSARHPEGVLALHTGTAHQDVLNRIVEHVPHVEHTSHIGWRNHDRIGFTSVGLT